MKNAAGFTLLEIVLGIAIFGLLATGLAALAYLYLAYGQLLPEEKLANEVSRQQQYSLEEMKRGIRQAESILSGVTLGSDSYTTGTTTIVLRLLSRDQANDVISGSFDYLVYYLATSTTPNKLWRRLEPNVNSSRKSSHFPLNSLVQNFTLTYNTSTPSQASKVTIDLTTKKTSQGETKSVNNVIEVTLR